MKNLVTMIAAAVLTVAVMAGFDLAMTESGRAQVSLFLHPPKVDPARPAVLLVAANASDQLNVITTAEPRGYQVVVVKNSDAGIGELSKPDNQIRVVAINGAAPNARYLARFAKTACPDAKIITFDKSEGPMHLTRQILNALV